MMLDKIRGVWEMRPCGVFGGDPRKNALMPVHEGVSVCRETRLCDSGGNRVSSVFRVKETENQKMEMVSPIPHC